MYVGPSMGKTIVRGNMGVIEETGKHMHIVRVIYYEYRPAAPGDRSYAVSWDTGLITTEKAYALRNLTAEERRENKK